jgi:hypothetical protein
MDRLLSRAKKRFSCLVHSSPNVIPANHRDTKESAELNLVWSLQFHKTGISFAAGRVIDRAILPESGTLLRTARYKNKSLDRTVAFPWIRIVDIGFLSPVSCRRLAQSHNPGTESAFTFEHLKCGIRTLPESNRGCSMCCRNCHRSKPGGDQPQEQTLKSESVHMFCYTLNLQTRTMSLVPID